MNLEHLGGHCNITHIDVGALKWLKTYLDLYKPTLLDIGCGPGGQVELANDLGFKAFGLEGDYSLLQDNKLKIPEKIYFSDLTKTKIEFPINFDIIWCVEVAEHIEKKFTNNLIETIKLNIKHNSLVIFTACSKENTGIHHVNIKQKDWWIEKFKEFGFTYLDYLTHELKKHSTMKREFIKENGMIFTL